LVFFAGSAFLNFLLEEIDLKSSSPGASLTKLIWSATWEILDIPRSNVEAERFDLSTPQKRNPGWRFFTNPFEKYANRQNGIKAPQFSG